MEAFKKQIELLDELRKFDEFKYKELKEKILIKEAKRRGFKDEVGINNANLESVKWKDTIGRVDGNNQYYKPEEDIFVFGSKFIYQKGKWAEIIQTITKEEAEKQLGKKIV